MAVLNVNIDHVATIRQARRTDEPDPAWAAVECELAGANGITVHLRRTAGTSTTATCGCSRKPSPAS